jgi:hypothetical protein
VLSLGLIIVKKAMTQRVKRRVLTKNSCLRPWWLLGGGLTSGPP